MNSMAKKLKDFLTPTKVNFLWMMLGNGVYALCQWGMLVVLAKLGSPEVVGQFALALAIISPVIMITNMQLRGVQATDAKKEFFLSDYMAVRIFSTMGALVLVLMILKFGHYGKAVFLATITLLLAKSIESLSDVFYGFFQQHEKMGFMARSMILKGFMSVVVLGLFFRFFRSLPWALAGLWGAWLAVFLLYDNRMARALLLTVEGSSRVSWAQTSIDSIHKRRQILFHIMKLAFPLGIVMGIISLNTNIPRYAIEKYLGARELGIFAALAYTTIAVNMFIQALGQAVSPKLARYFSDKNYKAFDGMLRQMIVINLGIGLLGLLIIAIGGAQILSLIFTHEYAAYSNLFIILMAASTLLGVASALGYGMTAARQFVWQVPLSLAVLATTVLASFLLIPCFKLYGAAMALILSSLVQTFGGFLIVRTAIRNQSV